MGIRLIVEVLDHAPDELTPRERLLLVALAEKASDDTRTCWPGMDTLTRRTGLSPSSVRAILAQLAEHGYEIRVPAGTDRNGNQTFAHNGRATAYRVPHFRQRRQDPAALKAPGSRCLDNGRAPGSGHEGARIPAPFSLKNPQKNPQINAREKLQPSSRHSGRGPERSSTSTTRCWSSSNSPTAALASALGWRT